MLEDRSCSNDSLALDNLLSKRRSCMKCRTYIVLRVRLLLVLAVPLWKFGFLLWLFLFLHFSTLLGSLSAHLGRLLIISQKDYLNSSMINDSLAHSCQNPHTLRSEIPNDLALVICYCYRQLANLLSAPAKYTVRIDAVQEEIQEKEAQATCPQERETKS